MPGFIWSAPGNACARRLFYQWCKRRDVPCWNQKAGCCRCIPCGILPAWECGCPCKAGGMPSFRPGCVLLNSVILYRSCFYLLLKNAFSASNEPSGCTCASVWRLPRKSNIPPFTAVGWLLVGTYFISPFENKRSGSQQGRLNWYSYGKKERKLLSPVNRTLNVLSYRI